MRARILLAFLLFASTSCAQPAPNQSIDQFLAVFIRAFDDLDWDTFRTCFADDASVFYPRAWPERADGRRAFEKTFRSVFETIRAGRSSPPYMAIEPKNLRVQQFGNLAIVTFHLDDRPGFVNRRTLVLLSTSQGWKIVHLHASEVAVGR